MNIINALMIGNANTGKTTLFNELTKSNLHTGNWYGVTVSGEKKAFRFKGYKIILEDLPGIYSLKLAGAEEKITLNRLRRGGYDLVLNICEVKALARNLYLSLQLKALGVNMILVVNMADEQKDFVIDFDLLSKTLQVPVVSISAKKRINLDILCEQIIKSYKSSTQKPIQDIEKRLQDLNAPEAYSYIDNLMQRVKKQKTTKNDLSKADKIILNRFLCLPIFALIMGAVFFLTFELAGRYFSNILGQGIAKLESIISTGLKKAGASLGFNKLVSEAILGGAGSVIEFLPQITLLFLCLAILEDSGYMARAAYVLDGALQKIGLNGRAAYTLLMGFGCSASAVFTAKSIEQPSVRLKTVMITPFISCSARMPVFLAISGTFFSKFSYLVVTGLYIGGIIAACVWALILNKFLKIDIKENDFFIELPPYRLPSFKRVLKTVLQEIKNFFIRVCTVLFLVNIVVWVLGSFDWRLSYVGLAGDSILKSISQILLPLFLPIGITKWQVVSALICGLVAKETVVSTIATLGGISQIFPTWTQALPFLIFVLLYSPCVATIVAVSKELGKKWALVSFLIHLGCAYLISMIVFGLILIADISLNIIIILAALLVIYLIIRTAFKFELNKKES
ncbi:MAG TPA: ferrous iron transporter B [Clostridiales bacterium]|nr:ferrous iron transporter B [Clostridiales bacterium]